MNLFLMAAVVLSALAAGAGVGLFLLRRGQAAAQGEGREAPPPDKENPNSLLLEKAALDQFLYDRCCQYMMDRRPFLVETYRLQDLARALFTNKLYLSQTINRFSGKNFRQYVNYYRVMYAMELFRGNMGLRVNELSGLSGFHSESSFVRSFKRVTGIIPSHWCAFERRKSQAKYKRKP